MFKGNNKNTYFHYYIYIYIYNLLLQIGLGFIEIGILIVHCNKSTNIGSELQIH